MEKEVLHAVVKNAVREALAAKNALPDKAIKEDWVRAAADAYKDLLDTGMTIHKDRDKAIAYANSKTTAGPAAKTLAIKEFFK